MNTAPSTARPLKVALLGCGVVGSEVARLLTRDGDELARRIGAPIELVGIAVRRLGRARDLDLPADLFTTDAQALVTRGDLDVVVEVIGGIEPARELILAALEHGASVVTANKALLAEDGARLFEAAEKAERDIAFEAAVAGAIPIIRPLQESLAGDAVQRVLGIVNGTTNFILDAMTTTGAGFSDALDEAQRLGYAEADPTADVEGFDAAAKAAIIASLAFHTRVTIGDVHREGITDVTAADVRSADEMGCVVKLLAICEKISTPDGDAVSARVHPAMIAKSHPLASVRGAFNAVFVESESAGQLMFYGPGAGGAPTASAVLGDLVSVARNPPPGRARTRRHRPRRPRGARRRPRPYPLPRVDRRRRPRGRARVGRRRLRAVRRVDQDGPPGGPRLRRPARHRDARGRRRRARRDRRGGARARHGARRVVGHAGRRPQLMKEFH
ncbi:homoserine dehydrogenase [Aeromicrobium sp. SORGH_AS981]|nr:homoserine dehydrogenase [Aeromicrobium sp. SORGH_AS_0981]